MSESALAELDGTDPSTAKQHRRTIIGYVILLVAVVATFLSPSGEGTSYGAWSLLPAVTLFVFVMVTEKVVEGFLWAGLLVTWMIYRGDFGAAWVGSLTDQVGNPDNAYLLVLLALVGGLLGVLDRTGLTASFAESAAKLARGKRGSGAVTAVSSALLSNDSYLSAAGVGVAMTPVNRRFGLPKSFTAAVLRTTGEPATTLNPFGSTSVMIAGLMVTAGYGTSQLDAYLDVIPFLFYSIAAFIIGFLLAVGVIPPLFALKKDFENIDQDEAFIAQDDEGEQERPNPLIFIAAIVTIVAVSIITGEINMGLVSALAVTGLLLLVTKHRTITEYIDDITEGMKDLFPLLMLMVLAFVLVSGISGLGFTDFIIDNVDGAINPRWLPFVIFAIFGVTEMLVTLNWSLYLLMVPILVELASHTGASVPATVAALLSAGTLGIAAAISSDVGMLTASSTQVPLYRHWITNLPYNLAAAAIALVGFAIVGIMGIGMPA